MSLYRSSYERKEHLKYLVSLYGPTVTQTVVALILLINVLLKGF